MIAHDLDQKLLNRTVAREADGAIRLAGVAGGSRLLALVGAGRVEDMDLFGRALRIVATVPARR